VAGGASAGTPPEVGALLAALSASALAGTAPGVPATISLFLPPANLLCALPCAAQLRARRGPLHRACARGQRGRLPRLQLEHHHWRAAAAVRRHAARARAGRRAATLSCHAAAARGDCFAAAAHAHAVVCHAGVADAGGRPRGRARRRLRGLPPRAVGRAAHERKRGRGRHCVPACGRGQRARGRRRWSSRVGASCVFPPPRSMPCASCGAVSAESTCCGCHIARYCNEACQKAHWKAHRPACKAASAAAAKAATAAAKAGHRRPCTSAAPRAARRPLCAAGGRPLRELRRGRRHHRGRREVRRLLPRAVLQPRVPKGTLARAPGRVRGGAAGAGEGGRGGGTGLFSAQQHVKTCDFFTVGPIGFFRPFQNQSLCLCHPPKRTKNRILHCNSPGKKTPHAPQQGHFFAMYCELGGGEGGAVNMAEVGPCALPLSSSRILPCGGAGKGGAPCCPLPSQSPRSWHRSFPWRPSSSRPPPCQWSP
jgi:hypothetical protein